MRWFSKKTVAGAVGVLAATVTLVGGFEGLKTKAYKDVVGVPTICYGETKGVKLGQTKTVAECNKMLEARLQEFYNGVDKCVTVEMPDGVKIAFTSLAYNIGIGQTETPKRKGSGFCGSTVVKKANAGDWKASCNAIRMWNKGKVHGKMQVLKGLDNRRVEEQKLCLSSIP